MRRRGALPATASGGAVPQREPRLKDWFGVVAMVVGMFLAIMDIQIVTSSLAQIGGGLSATPDEIGWVQTAYLIADVVMIPLSGMLSRIFSTRVLFSVASLGFAATSALCASATNLDQMILFRALQGFNGGALVPAVFPVVYTLFPPRQLATMMVLISLILNLSSTLGPTIGGYLTDAYSWHAMFLVNIVPGVAVAAAVWTLIDVDKPDFSLLRRFDILGLVLMATFLGSLQYALQEGPRWDWLADRTIATAVLVSAVAGVTFLFRAFTYREPIIDLRAFANRNFALGTAYTFVIGTGLYGATYLLPLFLAEVRGYNSLQIGLTVFVTGAAQMVVSPLANFLTRKIDLRLMLAIGMALFVLAMVLNATLTDQTGFDQLLLPQAVRGVALMFCFLPANLIALGSLPAEKLKNGASLYNLMRDLGGAFSIAAIGTMMNERLHFHWNRLIEDINPARHAVTRFLASEAHRLALRIPGNPHAGALRLLAKLVERQALTLTYNDLLLMLATGFFIGLFLIPLLKEPRIRLRVDSS
jgi:MFS transporter, DHA2 family, multidrug resistance protein